jgi:hypothetical protein
MRHTLRALYADRGRVRMIISFTKQRRYGEHCMTVVRKTRGYSTTGYSLVLMVYAELKLERKVDRSTYPTTLEYPLYIGKT